MLIPVETSSRRELNAQEIARAILSRDLDLIHVALECGARNLARYLVHLSAEHVDTDGHLGEVNAYTIASLDLLIEEYADELARVVATRPDLNAYFVGLYERSRAPRFVVEN